LAPVIFVIRSGRATLPTRKTHGATEMLMTMSRRTFIQAAATGAAAASILPPTAIGQATAPLTRSIPSSGEQIPAVGLGTWITFNVGDDRRQGANVQTSWAHSSRPAGA
jgi:hypothetical protein